VYIRTINFLNICKTVFPDFFINFPSIFREADGDDDIIFEDFARLRLKGETEA